VEQGKTVFVTLQSGGYAIAGDPLDRYLLLSDGKGGDHALRISLMDSRLTCTKLLSAAWRRRICVLLLAAIPVVLIANFDVLLRWSAVVQFVTLQGAAVVSGLLAATVVGPRVGKAKATHESDQPA